MTTSYSKKIHLLNLFVFYTFDRQVSLFSEKKTTKQKEKQKNKKQNKHKKNKKT